MDPRRRGKTGEKFRKILRGDLVALDEFWTTENLGKFGQVSVGKQKLEGVGKPGLAESVWIAALEGRA
jgi:hypothetical protein